MNTENYVALSSVTTKTGIFKTGLAGIQLYCSKENLAHVFYLYYFSVFLSFYIFYTMKFSVRFFKLACYTVGLIIYSWLLFTFSSFSLYFTNLAYASKVSIRSESITVNFYIYIALDKAIYLTKSVDICLYFLQKYTLWVFNEAPCQGTSECVPKFSACLEISVFISFF